LSKLIAQHPAETAVWVVFDNTAAGAALEDALRFMHQPSIARRN